MPRWTEFAERQPELAEWTHGRLALPPAFLVTVQADATSRQPQMACIVNVDRRRSGFERGVHAASFAKGLAAGQATCTTTSASRADAIPDTIVRSRTP
jgi:hypothetical protein